MKTRTRTIQALALATIGGTIWTFWDIAPLVWRIVSRDLSIEYLVRWGNFRLHAAVVSVMAGVVAIRTLLKFKQLRPLCGLTVVLLIVDLCVFGWRWFLHFLGNLRMLTPQWSDLQFVLVYVVPLALLTIRIFGKFDPRDESGADGETMDGETKACYGLLYAFLVPISIGLWIGSALLSASRLGGFAVLAFGIGLGIVWALWLGRRAEGERTGLITRLLSAFVRAITDLFAGIKALFAGIKLLLFAPLPLSWGLVWTILAGLVFVVNAVIAIGLLSDAADAEYRAAKTVLQLAAFKWAFGGLVCALHLWAIGGFLFPNILITRQNLARVQFANGRGLDEKGISQTERMPPPPPGRDPNRLGGWAVVCRIVAVICLVLLLPACIVALFAEDSDVAKAGGIGIPCVIFAFFWWKTWAEIFRLQDEASVEARTQERWLTASNPAIFGVEQKSSSGRTVDQRQKWEADAVRGLLGLEAVVLFALVVCGIWPFWTSVARANTIAAGRKAKEAARRVALVWKGESKSIPISDSVAIELRSVPGNCWFGQYEVTQSQWEAVMGEKCPIPSWRSGLIGSSRPAVYVSWDDSQDFLRKLNALPAVKKSGLWFRLPTEEEWEYACRAGATGDYCLLADGTEITTDTLGRVAWFEDNSDSETHPIGRKQPNAFGLYDVHGNVWEWTSTAIGEDRVSRGGSLDDSASFCKFSAQSRCSHSAWGHNLGFRLCAESAASRECWSNRIQIETAVNNWLVERLVEHAAERLRNTAIDARKESSDWITENLTMESSDWIKMLLDKGYFRKEPKCPSGGVYSIVVDSDLEAQVKCSIPDHSAE